jgi:hypothetical protein
MKSSWAISHVTMERVSDILRLSLPLSSGTDVINATMLIIFIHTSGSHRPGNSALSQVFTSYLETQSVLLNVQNVGCSLALTLPWILLFPC